MLELLAIGGVLAWTMMNWSQQQVEASTSAKQTQGNTDKLLNMVDNGFQFRDNMFSTMADWLSHPDVKNNYFALHRQQHAVEDPGIYGTARKTVQLYDGVSEPVQLSRQSNLVL